MFNNKKVLNSVENIDELVQKINTLLNENIEDKKNFHEKIKSSYGIKRYKIQEVIKPNQVILVQVLKDERGQKGAALSTGFSAATGDICIVQDADLEYDPADWAAMYELVTVRGVADVVYGSRFYGRPHRALYFHHYMANRLISFLFNALYNQQLTDIEVCYKMFTREVLESLAITANDFGFEVQFSAQVALARRWRIYEVGISYYGRTYDEGKKINWTDGVKALWYLVKYRLA